MRLVLERISLFFHLQVFYLSCLHSNSQFDYTVSCATGATLASLVILSTYTWKKCMYEIMSQNLYPNILSQEVGWSWKVEYKANAPKRLSPLHAKSDKKAICSLPSLLPSSFLRKSFFWVRRNFLQKRTSHAEGREERRLPCWPINQSVINVVVTIPVSWILNTYLSGIKLLERTKRQVYFKKLKKILGLFLDLPWHLPSLPTTTGCPQDSDWVRRVDWFLRMLCIWC